ncbi:hypothetical protein L1887_50890 [Cichorium endivia]|nr:hypothetical protein L1887_50890 [Cichorium endivia]
MSRSVRRRMLGGPEGKSKKSKKKVEKKSPENAPMQSRKTKHSRSFLASNPPCLVHSSLSCGHHPCDVISDGMRCFQGSMAADVGQCPKVEYEAPCLFRLTVQRAGRRTLIAAIAERFGDLKRRAGQLQPSPCRVALRPKSAPFGHMVHAPLTWHREHGAGLGLPPAACYRRDSSHTTAMSFAAFAKSLPPSLSLVGRTALVTGSSSGIGRQTALHLARAGANVLCTDLRPEPLGSEDTAKSSRTVPTHELIQTLGGRAEFQQLNVTSESEFEAAIAKSVSFGGGRLDM